MVPQVIKFPEIPNFPRELSGEAGPLININKFRKPRTIGSINNEVQQAVEVEVTKMATKSEKLKYHYSDFYCFMSLADFTAYISRDDGDGEGGFSISQQ